MTKTRAFQTALLFLFATCMFPSPMAFSPSRIKRMPKNQRSTMTAMYAAQNNKDNHHNKDWILMIGATLALSTLPLNPAPALGEATSTTAAVDVGHGSQLFQANCAACHANGMNYVSAKRTLKKDAIETYRKTTDPIAIQDFVQQGMPHKFFPFSNEFSNSDYQDVVSYVLDQALNDKW